MPYNVKIKNLVEYHEPKDASELREQSATKAPAEHLQCTNIVGGGIVGDSPDGADIERPDIPNYATEAYERRIEVYRDQIKSGVQEIDADQPNLAQRCIDGINEIELEPPHPKGDPMDIRHENTWFNYKLREAVVRVGTTVGCSIEGAGVYVAGSSCTLKLILEPHYSADASTWSGLPADTTYSADYITATFKVPAAGCTASATCISKYHTLTFTALNGTLSQTTFSGEEGETVTVTTTPLSAYHEFTAWWDVTDPTAATPVTGSTASYEFTVGTTDQTFEARNLAFITFTGPTPTNKITSIWALGMELTRTTTEITIGADIYYKWHNDMVPDLYAVCTKSIWDSVAVGEDVYMYDGASMSEVGSVDLVVHDGFATLSLSSGNDLQYSTNKYDWTEWPTAIQTTWYDESGDPYVFNRKPGKDMTVEGTYYYAWGEASTGGRWILYTKEASLHDGIMLYAYDGTSMGESLKLVAHEYSSVLVELTGLSGVVYVRGKSMSNPITGFYGTFNSVSGHVMSLVDYDNLSISAADYQFYNEDDQRGLFTGCDSLEDASGLTLPSSLGEYCCSYMFRDCGALKKAPALPATTLSEGCYQSMFAMCGDLVNPPDLPALITAPYCYQRMFESCSSLSSVPSLPATELKEYCYQYMFASSGITSVSIPSGITVGDYSMEGMFQICKSLSSVGDISVISVGDYGMRNLFYNCTSLTDGVGSISVTGNVSEGGMTAMFQECTNLSKFTDITIDGNVGIEGMASMFNGLKKLIEFGNITIRGEVDNKGMHRMLYCFGGDTTLDHVGDISIGSIKGASSNDNGGMYQMFNGRNGLKTVGNITATSVGTYGMHMLFANRAALTTVGKITIDSIVSNRFFPSGSGGLFQMFLKHSKLTVGDIVVNEVGRYGMEQMFKRDSYSATSSLSIGVNSQIKKVTDINALERMFEYSSIASVPSDLLPTFQLADYCYQCMFQGCEALTTSPSLPATSLTKGCYKSMFQGCTSLTTISGSMSVSSVSEDSCNAMFQDCTSLTSTPSLPATSLATRCYYRMFYNCSSLTLAPELPATTIAESCYEGMFYTCEKLTLSASFTLQATTLFARCYHSMFSGCKAITSAPALPATTLTPHCYASMFSTCTSITAAPALQATSLTESCYEAMFQDCTGIASVPSDFLPATSLAKNCYYSMFWGCTSLTSAPALPATTLADSCYYKMFYHCTALISAPNLPATDLISNCYYQMFDYCHKLTGPISISATTAPATAFTQDMFANAGTSRPSTPTDYNKIKVGGNVLSWNSTNAGINSTYWTVELI